MTHPTIEAHLQQLTQRITAALHPQSILLLGSAARDELSYYQHPDGRLELFSDYECLIVVPRRPTADQHHTLQTSLTQLEREINNPNPLFHIDLAILTPSRLRTFPPIIFTYEMKTNGRLLAGQDPRPLLPTITPATLDQQDTNEIIYKRLWAILLHLPLNYVLGQPSSSEQRVWGYVLARNLLDISTVLLPPEGILLPTYTARVQAITKHYPQLSFANHFGPDLPHALQQALQHRQHLNFSGLDLNRLYQQTIIYFEHCLAYLMPSPTADLTTSLATQSTQLFHESPQWLAQWRNLIKMAMRHSRLAGSKSALQWVRLPKKGWLTIGLLAMHHSLIAHQQGDTATAETHLTAAHTALQKLHPTPPQSPDLPFTERWLSLRWQWGLFWQQYIRLGDPKLTEQFTHITQWEER